MVSIIGLDLVLPAVINVEWNWQRRLKGYNKYSDAYIRGMRFCEQDFMNFAHNMNFRLIGRVICSFDVEDVRKCLRTSGYFVKDSVEDNPFYFLDLPEKSIQTADISLSKLLSKLKQETNYTEDVMISAGLV